jgi:RimJ/RimL family protein N-acetyltransferase
VAHIGDAHNETFSVAPVCWRFTETPYNNRCSAMEFELQPILKGELIELRPLAPQDWDELFAVASDSLIWEQHPEPDRYKEGVFRVFFKEALESGGAFVIIDRKTQHIVGQRGSTVTIRRNPRSKLDGHFSRENTGAADTTRK